MPDPFEQYVISVMSRDRIGIIAEVAGAISSVHGDIADLRQSVLRDYFTMILLARFPAGVSAAAVAEVIIGVSQASPHSAGAYGASAEPLHVMVEPATPGNEDYSTHPERNPDRAEPGRDIVEGRAGEHNYLLTARGPDRIGFVAAVSAFCAANGLNILDLATIVFKGDYVMMLLVDVSRCGDLDALRERLAAFGREAGLYAVLQHEAIFRATNEVDR
jgi:glycine cleavage system transcriptional repressor